MNLQSFVPEEVEAALGRRYTVGPNIASGGQGAVFRATRTSKPDGTATNDPVALKLHFDPRQVNRVLREVTALENLSHPNALHRLRIHRRTIAEAAAESWKVAGIRNTADRA